MELTLELKAKVIQKFIQTTEAETEALKNSAKSAQLAATHEESRAEDSHDTFAIEASYLAAGQAERVLSLQKTAIELKTLLSEKIDTKEFKAISVGALFKLQNNNKELIYFFAKSGGGTKISIDSDDVSITTANSALGEQAFGLCVGDEILVETKSGDKTYNVLEII
jgi:hypothetical protein